MPPRTCPAGGARSWCAFFAYAGDAGGWSAPRRLDGGEVHRLGNRTRVYAVPCTRLPAVLLAARDDEIDGDLLDADAGIPRSTAVSMILALPDADPAVRLLTHYRVGEIQDGRVLLVRVAEERYDAAGRPVPVPPGRLGGGPSTFLLLLSFLLISAALTAALYATLPGPAAPPGADEEVGPAQAPEGA